MFQKMGAVTLNFLLAISKTSRLLDPTLKDINFLLETKDTPKYMQKYDPENEKSLMKKFWTIQVVAMKRNSEAWNDVENNFAPIQINLPVSESTFGIKSFFSQ